MRSAVLSLPRVCALSAAVAVLLLAASAFAGTKTIELTAPDPGVASPDPGRAIEAAPGAAPSATPSAAAPEDGGSRGWPVNLHAPGAGFPYTPTLFDVDHDGADEIFLTGGETFGLRGDGTFLPGWPTTDHTVMGYGTNEQKPAPSAADLEGDGDVEIMWSLRDWWAGSAHMWCFNGRESNGSNMPQMPQFAPDDYSNAIDVPFVLGDADGDGNLEAWGPHSLGNNFIHYRLSAFDHLGNRLFTRDLNPAENMLSLYFGDVDGNGAEEFFTVTWQDPAVRLYVFNADGSNAPGYPVSLGSYTGGYLMFGPPVPVDMDNDGDLEFLIGYNSGSTSRAYAKHHDGTAVTGYPIVVASSSQLYYLAVGDLTGDGQPELVALDNHLAGTNRALAFTLSTGAALPGWPFYVNDWPHGYPCIADVDGNGRQDFCLSTEGGQVFAIGADGLALPGYPKTMSGPSISGVAAGDIDGDGLFELVSSTWNGWVHAWDTTGPALPGRADWPMRGVDARNTGVYRRGDVTGAPSHPAFAQRLTITPNPVRDGAQFRLPGAADGTTVEILDVAGRHVDSVRLLGGRAGWQAGTDLSTGVYLVRAVDGTGAVRHGRLVLVR